MMLYGVEVVIDIHQNIVVDRCFTCQKTITLFSEVAVDRTGRLEMLSKNVNMNFVFQSMLI